LPQIVEGFGVIGRLQVGRKITQVLSGTGNIVDTGGRVDVIDFECFELTGEKRSFERERSLKEKKSVKGGWRRRSVVSGAKKKKKHVPKQPRLFPPPGWGSGLFGPLRGSNLGGEG